jgi:hypothetical protein
MIDKKHTVSVVFQDVYNECERKTQMWNNARPDANLDGFTISKQDVQQIMSWVMEGSALISDRSGFVKHQDQTGLDALTYYPEYELKAPNPDYTISTNVVVTSIFNGETITATIEDIDELPLASVEIKTLDVLYLTGQTDTDENGYYRVGAVIGDLIKYRELLEVTQTNNPDGRLIYICDIIKDGKPLESKLPKNNQDTIQFNVTDAVDQNRYTIIQQFIKSALQSYILWAWWTLKGVVDQAQLEYVIYERMVQNMRFNSVSNHKLRGKFRRSNYHG